MLAELQKSPTVHIYLLLACFGKLSCCLFLVQAAQLGSMYVCSIAPLQTPDSSL